MWRKNFNNKREPFHIIIADAIEDAGKVFVDTKTWNKYNKRKTKNENGLYNYITNNVPVMYQEQLNILIEDLLDSMGLQADFENKQYYYRGFKDAIELYTYLFSNKIIK